MTDSTMQNNDESKDPKDAIPTKEQRQTPMDGNQDQTDRAAPTEHGGRPGLDPTRYGDWEKNGRCVDF